MKAIIVFLFCVVLLIGCGKFEDETATPTVSSNGYLWSLNAITKNDSAFYLVNDIVLAEILKDGQRVTAEFNFGDGSASILSDRAANKYTKEGTYKLTATIKNVTPEIKLVATVIIKKLSAYNLRIDDKEIENGGTFKTNEGTLLNFRVFDHGNGKNVITNFDFGDGDKVATDSIKKSYKTAGTYKLTAITGGITLTATIEVSKAKLESIVLISSSISSGNITAVIGLKCDDIYQVVLTKDTYVAGEIPGATWKNYKLTEIEVINGVNYFKWSVTVPAGKFRVGWVQMKTGGVDLYKEGNWSYNFSSAFFSNDDGLFVFYLKIENNIVKLTAN